MNTVKQFFINIFNVIIEAREAKARAYLEYYKRTGRTPYWD